MRLKQLIDKIKKPTKSVVFRNFSALMVLQVGNTVLALLIMPYLISVLGISNYGLYSFAFAISVYLVVLTDYDFGFTGVKLISVHRDDIDEVSSIFHSIQIIILEDRCKTRSYFSDRIHTLIFLRFHGLF